MIKIIKSGLQRLERFPRKGKPDVSVLQDFFDGKPFGKTDPPEVTVTPKGKVKKVK